MRSLVNKVFTPRAIKAQEDVVRERVSTICRSSTRQFDVVADFSALFPVEVITTMLGVPRDPIARWCGSCKTWRCDASPARCG